MRKNMHTKLTKLSFSDNGHYMNKYEIQHVRDNVFQGTSSEYCMKAVDKDILKINIISIISIIAMAKYQYPIMELPNYILFYLRKELKVNLKGELHPQYNLDLYERPCHH